MERPPLSEHLAYVAKRCFKEFPLAAISTDDADAYHELVVRAVEHVFGPETDIEAFEALCVLFCDEQGRKQTSLRSGAWVQHEVDALTPDEMQLYIFFMQAAYIAYNIGERKEFDLNELLPGAVMRVQEETFTLRNPFLREWLENCQYPNIAVRLAVTMCNVFEQQHEEYLNFNDHFQDEINEGEGDFSRYNSYKPAEAKDLVLRMLSSLEYVTEHLTKATELDLSPIELACYDNLMHYCCNRFEAEVVDVAREIAAFASRPLDIMPTEKEYIKQVGEFLINLCEEKDMSWNDGFYWDTTLARFYRERTGIYPEYHEPLDTDF